MKKLIKKIISDILYLDEHEQIDDDSSLFIELGLSSIDYIDLCFELKQALNKDITQDNLWPFNKMVLEKRYYLDNQWTKLGWAQVCRILNLTATEEKLSLSQLYRYFTVNYLYNRVQDLT
jgi:acyl carrier protein